MATYVIFDLETNSDRADVAEHEIIEIGAVAVKDGTVVEEFQTLVRPTRPVRSEVLELTDIELPSLEAAPDLSAALSDFLAWVDGRPLVAHNGHGYDYLVLDAACEEASLERHLGQRLDSLDLAHIAFPRAGRGLTKSADGSVPPEGRGLDNLATYLELETEDRHRALPDAALTHQVILLLLDRLEIPDPQRVLQRWVLHEGSHPWAEYLSAPEQPPPLEDTVPEAPRVRLAPPTETFDINGLVAAFQVDGILMTEGRAPRPQQGEMARSVAQALAKGETRLIEAPTGTGKTLAYLAPAIQYARASGSPVIVAAHSKVLQNQILASIEELHDTFGPFTAALLKGRDNYLSLEALEGEIEADIPDSDTALALAVVVGWAAETPSGDFEDLRAWSIEQQSPALGLLRWKLRVNSSPGPPVSELDRLCFYRRALSKVSECHIAVFNHALLVSRSDWVSSVRHLILDEAHNLEESATAALSDEITQTSVGTLCHTVWDPAHRSGTLRRLLDATGRSLQDPSLHALREAVEQTREAAAELSGQIIEYARNRTGAQKEEVEKYGTSYRIRRGMDTLRPSYQPVLRAAGALRSGLRSIRDAFNSITIPAELRGRYKRRRLEAEVARLGRTASEWADLIDAIAWGVADDVWINIVDLQVVEGDWKWGLRRVPITIAPQLREIWESLDATILTSATLRVGESFDHIISTLGLGAAQVLALGTPFTDLTQNHMVILTDYLPSPRGRLLEEFTYAEASEIPRLFVLTHGRGMALFTARSRLEYVRDHARTHVEIQGIPLLAQGDEPSPALAERMRTDVTASLLALRSFWEGIDVPGEALSLLIVEKVPFDPPNDPIVAARMEAIEMQGRDPFGEYLVPRAALRFAQGVGRLIRSNDDIGATVVLDNRLRRPVPYRERMLGSLVGPPRFVRADTRPEAYQAIADHLAVTLDDELWAAIERIPSADPWSELEALELTSAELESEELILKRLEQVRERFGFNEWRPGQLEAMLRFMKGEDVLAVLPTGSGKSITYQIPALLCPGVTLVISPLIALMRDQAENLRARGITKVAAIHSGVPQSEQQAILRGAAKGQYKLLYVSPERLWSPMFRAGLKQIAVARVAVDEAHCISQWGHSFRPEYTLIPDALQALTRNADRPPVLAATATATVRVRTEIADLLNLRLLGPAIVRSPDRPEIRYFTEWCGDFQDRDLRVLDIVDAFRGESAIVYVPKRRDAQRIAGLLQAAGHLARPYHGAMETEERLHIEDAFRHGETDLVVATKAFGLGIDKPDIALIVHLEMPASIEEYVQETGRVARGAIDGFGPETGTCVLLVTPRDCSIHRFFVESAAPDIEAIKGVWSKLETGDNYKPPDELAGVSDDYDQQTAMLAVHYLAEDGAIRRHQDIVWEGRVWVPSDAVTMVEELAQDEPDLASQAREVIEVIDQIGSYEYHPRRWSERLKRKPQEIEGALLELHGRDIIGFSAWKYAWQIERLPGAEPDWARIEGAAQRRRASIHELSTRAKAFKADTRQCRTSAILEYLGVESRSRCGRCDICTPDLPRPWAGERIRPEEVAQALPAKRLCMSLVLDAGGAGFSRRNLVRTLLGDENPKFPLSRHLREHPAFGRLTILGYDGINMVFDQLIADGLVEEQVRQLKDGGTYVTLVSTQEGRRKFR